MKTHLSLRYERSDALPAHVDPADDVRTPEALVEHFVEASTERGDVVFDPFAGFGTTLAVAADRGRVPYGVEFEAERVVFVRERLGDRYADHVRRGSALDLEPDDLPPVDCCFTSPPFMAEGMTVNPFESYAGESSYADYLDDAREAFARVGRCLAPGGRVVVDVSNLKHDDRVTTLAWDLGTAVADELDFRGEVVVAWEGEGTPGREGAYGYGYDHSYCLVYGAPGGD